VGGAERKKENFKEGKKRRPKVYSYPGGAGPLKKEGKKNIQKEESTGKSHISR